MEEIPLVLIVDDDKDILNIMRYALESYGYRVRTCENAAEAERDALAGCCDFIITDHDMQGMDGLELTRRLRQRCQRSVIIGMSGSDLSLEFLGAGANDFVQKPFVPYDVVMMIDGGDLPS